MDRGPGHLFRAPRAVQPGAGRVVHAGGAQRAHRQSRGLEQDRTADQLRRERRLLRPCAAAVRPRLRRRHAGRRDHAARRRTGRRIPRRQAPVRPRPARADVCRVAVEPRRLGQLAGVRPHLGAALPGGPLWRRGKQYQRLPPRGGRGPDLGLQLRQPQHQPAALAAQPRQGGRRCHPHRAGRAAAGAAAPGGHPADAAAGARHAPVARIAVRVACQRPRRRPRTCGAAAVRQHRQGRRGLSCL
ncbi:hypothetical protein D9M72_423750 [compost metagenome]